MKPLRIGIVGTGNIAQKAWLPVLSSLSDITLIGAWSPTEFRARSVCQRWRINYYSTLAALSADCDAMFVHTSTASHFVVVSELLRAGVHVCVDKPLANSFSEAIQLVELARQQNRQLMVAFNRRFAPLYRDLRAEIPGASLLRLDKHRIDDVGPNDLHFTLLDDYLHVIDTALWLAGGRLKLEHGALSVNENGEMIFASHHFSHQGLEISCAMHRRAGTGLERAELLGDGALIRVTDMHTWEAERGQGLYLRPVSGWQSHLEQRGFIGCARHFIESIANQTTPETSGEQALAALQIVDKIWRRAIGE